MQANLDKSITIKDSDVDSYHVEFTRLEPVSEQPSRPNEVKSVQIFLKRDWAQTKANIKKYGIAHLNFHEHRIVHDPVKYRADLAEKAQADEEKMAKAAADADKKAKAAAKKEKTSVEGGPAK